VISGQYKFIDQEKQWDRVVSRYGLEFSGLWFRLELWCFAVAYFISPVFILVSFKYSRPPTVLPDCDNTKTPLRQGTWCSDMWRTRRTWLLGADLHWKGRFLSRPKIVRAHWYLAAPCVAFAYRSLYSHPRRPSGVYSIHPWIFIPIYCSASSKLDDYMLCYYPPFSRATPPFRSTEKKLDAYNLLVRERVVQKPLMCTYMRWSFVPMDIGMW